MVCVGFEDRFRKHQFSIYMSHKVGFISHKYNFKNKKGEYWLNETKEYLIMDRILFKDFSIWKSATFQVSLMILSI